MLWASAIISLSLIFFILYPLVYLFLAPQVGFSGFDHLDAFTWRVFAFTFGQALLSALLSGTVGLLGAFLYAEWRFPGREVFWKIVLLFFNLPSLFVAFAVASFWGRSGPIFPFLSHWIGEYSVFGMGAILLAHTLMNFPLYVKWVGLALVERPKEIERVALSLGASRLQVFCHITLYQIRRSIFKAFGTSFLLCSTSFVVVLILGGGPRFQTLEVGIYEAIKMNFDPGRAAVLALLQAGMGMVIYMLFVQPWSAARPQKVESASAGSIFIARSHVKKVLVLLSYFAVLVVVALGPLLTFAVQGLSGFLKVSWLGEVLPALVDTLSLAVGCAVIALVLAIAVGYFVKHSLRRGISRSVLTLSHTPLFLSGVVISTGILLAMPFSEVGKMGSLLTIASMQALLAFPFVFRPINDAWERFPRDWYYAARSSGAGPFQCFCWIEVPNLLRALGVAAATAMGFSIGELGVILVLYSGEVMPLSLVAFQALGKYRFQEGYAIGLLLVGVMMVLFFLADRWEQK